MHVRPTRPDRLRRRTWAMLAAGVAVVVGATVTTGVVAATAPVASIGGHPVSHDEYAFYSELVGDGSTTASRAGVLRAIADDQALLDVAAQAGVAGRVRDTAGLLRLRDTINAQNARDRADGKVVYGVGQYSPDEFHSRAVAQLGSAAVRALSTGSHPRLTVTPAQIAAEYRADPASWSAAATDYRFTTFTVPATVGAESGEAVLSRFAAQSAGSAASATIGIVGSTELTGAALASSGLSPDARAEIPTLREGGFLDPQSAQGSWVLYRLDGSTRDDAEAIRAYTPQITQVLVRRAFDSLVAARARDLLRSTP